MKRLITTQESNEPDEDEANNELAVWRRALETPFSQIERYDLYVRGVSTFDTHQGVKGREFQRVMVVISDDEARGFLFNYEKVFGATSKSRTDHSNEALGKETSIDRTTRLFYVTCSRAKHALAIVNYTSRPEVVMCEAVKRGWFSENEVELLPLE